MLSVKPRPPAHWTCKEEHVDSQQWSALWLTRARLKILVNCLLGESCYCSLYLWDTIVQRSDLRGHDTCRSQPLSSNKCTESHSEVPWLRKTHRHLPFTQHWWHRILKVRKRSAMSSSHFWVTRWGQDGTRRSFPSSALKHVSICLAFFLVYLPRALLCFFLFFLLPSIPLFVPVAFLSQPLPKWASVHCRKAS